MSHPFTAQDIANSGLSGAGGIDQGSLDDCVFEACAAAVATTPTGRATISEMIALNSNGSYTVTFPGEYGTASPATVTQSTLISTGVSDSATWADVLEAALITSDFNFANDAQLPPNATGAADGSSPTPAQYALYLLTGSLASKDVASSSSIGPKIAEALGNGQPVVAYCANNDQQALVSGHEWTVMTCNPGQNQITLRNPWGSFGIAGTTDHGVTYNGNAEVSMSLQLFGQFYGEVTFGYVPGLVGQIVLTETSTNSPALACLDGNVYLAWTGVGNNQLNVNCSTSYGASFGGKATSADTSLQEPALCAHQGTLYIGWSGISNNQLNIARVNTSGSTVTGFSNKVTLNETSQFSPALACANGLLYLAWTGVGNNQLNIAVSLNNGASFVNKYTSAETSTAAPTLTIQNGSLYIAWKGVGNDQINVGQVAISGNSITGIDNLVTLADTTTNAPALASNGTLYLAWKGDGNTDLNVEKSTDGGASFSHKYTSAQTSNVAPALCVLDGSIFLAWTGVSNDQLNVARVSG
jgi:hypothetical protein